MQRGNNLFSLYMLIEIMIISSSMILSHLVIKGSRIYRPFLPPVNTGDIELARRLCIVQGATCSAKKVKLSVLI